jgi:putative DNA-invertase from lambdoid prophage Rac
MCHNVFMSKRVAIYARCSTSDQSTGMQLDELREYADRRGWTNVAIYEDQGLSGTNTNRPELRRLMSDARLRKIDVVLSWRLDRVARSLRDLICLLQELGELGVEFISLRDNVDLTTSGGKLLFHLVGAFAEFEAEILRSRVKAGLANARRRGVQLGRPRRIDEGRLLELHRQGYSQVYIAELLGADKSTVSKTLKKLLAQIPEMTELPKPKIGGE